jgi:5-dehydro-2-deoxygluconokinase
VSTPLDLVAIGRVSVDLYGQQVGSPLEDISSFAKAVGGSPANVAIGAARLGLKSALITRVGDEPMGRFVREQLAREGVETRGVRVDPERLTALVLLSVRDAETFPLVFYRENCADAALSAEDVDEGLIASSRAVLVTGTHFALAAGSEAQRKAMRLARARGRKVILDIDYRPNLWGIGGHAAGASRYARSARVTGALSPLLADCDLIVGTEEEMHIAAGHEDTLEAVRRIRALSAAVIVLKRGPKGCVVFAGRIPARIEDALVAPGMDIEVYNVLGAGDAFLAGFLLGYLRDEGHEVCARYANACGALAVSRLLCSPEFPSRAELDHYLAHGSAYRALRADPQLSHLHWATTRSPAPATLCTLAAGERALAAVEAAARVAAGRAGFGVLLAGTPDAAALAEAQRQSLWLARAVDRPGSHPLELRPASLGAELLEWPAAVTVSCECRYHPDDSTGLREAQERNLLRLAAACRAQRRELLVGLCAAASGEGREDSVVRALGRLYELGIRPDWWALEPQAHPSAWEHCARVIGANDAYCRGVLVALDEPPEGAARALTVAATSPIVRGFIAGGSIFEGAASEPPGRDMAERFRALVEVWVSARDARIDRPERSGH